MRLFQVVRKVRRFILKELIIPRNPSIQKEDLKSGERERGGRGERDREGERKREKERKRTGEKERERERKRERETSYMQYVQKAKM